MKKIVLFFVVVSFISAQDFIGAEAPRFMGRQKNSIKRHYFDSQSVIDAHRGLIISFYASWCLPCRSELPFLQHLTDSVETVDMVAISVDETWGDSEEKVVEEMGVVVPILHDSYKIISQKYGYTGVLPYTVYVSPEGVIAAVTTSFSSKEKKRIEALVKKIY